MDPTQQSAAEYYKHHRKRSVITRITILSSMAILLLVLGINISVLYSQDQSTIQSHASSPQDMVTLLPSLPSGCVYEHVNKKVKIDCLKATLTPTTNIPINVALPDLPSECSFISSTTGSAMQCTATHTPIPTTPVNLPTTCTIANKPNTVTCRYGNNQTVTLPLPKLPDGCLYFLGANKYYVVCETK